MLHQPYWLCGLQRTMASFGACCGSWVWPRHRPRSMRSCSSPPPAKQVKYWLATWNIRSITRSNAKDTKEEAQVVQKTNKNSILVVSRRWISHHSEQDTNTVLQHNKRAAGKAIPVVQTDGAKIKQTSDAVGSTLEECSTDNTCSMRQQQSSAGKACQSWRLRLQKVLNNAISSCCIGVCCSVPLGFTTAQANLVKQGSENHN